MAQNATSSTPIYTQHPDDIAQTNKALAPSGSPNERQINGKVVYSANGRLMDIPNVVEWVMRAGNTLEERRRAARNLYLETLKKQIASFELRYKIEREKVKGLILTLDPARAFQHFLDHPDKDYMLLLAQHLHDLKAALVGTGFHAVTSEYKVLDNFIKLGLDYLNAFQTPVIDPGTYRFSAPPDNNLVMYTSGYHSDWQSATREAYSTAYKLGYALEDIYVFNYREKGPIQLAEVMGRNARFVGDFKVLLELEKSLNSDDKLDDPELLQYKAELWNSSPHLQNWTFTQEDNLNSTLLGNATALGRQLKQIKAARPGKKINLMASSQGSAVTVGFLLQKDTHRHYIFDIELAQVISSYSITISAHGGAFLSQAASFAAKTGIIMDLIKPIAKEIGAKITRDLAIDSDFTQANYAALADPITRERLKNVRGLEVYAANDDITTSVPLAVLPSTSEVRMVTGRHEEIIVGTAEGAGNKANKYIHNFLSGKLYPDLKSDGLIYSGYLKKGLSDFDVGAESPIPIPNEIRQGLVPLLTGKSGVIDYEVLRQVLKDIHDDFDLEIPKYWPKPSFAAFRP